MTRAGTIAAGLVLLIGSGAPGPEPEPEQKLRPADGTSQTEFGSSVAIDGDLMVVGARLSDDLGRNSGAAHVFLRTAGAWQQESTLLPVDGVVDQQFGISVDIDDGTAVVGAWRDDDNGLYSGSAYVFERTRGSWLQQAKLLPSDGSALDEFGRRVTVDGETIGVASGFDDDNGPSSGSVYIFVRRGNHWAEQAKLVPADGQPSDVFGSDIDIDGETVIIGAALDDDQGNDSGSAYVFVRSGSEWMQQAKLKPEDGNAGARFGSSVALDGDTAVIGSPEDNDNGFQSGSAYVFVRTNGVWSQKGKLLGADVDRGDEFGASVSISGNAAVVGAPLDSDPTISAGSAYLFALAGGEWTEQAKILAQDGAWTDHFGSAVALDCATLVISSPDNDESGPNAGAAYVFRTGRARCVDELYKEGDATWQPRSSSRVTR